MLITQKFFHTQNLCVGFFCKKYLSVFFTALTVKLLYINKHPSGAKNW